MLAFAAVFWCLWAVPVALSSHYIGRQCRMLTLSPVYTPFCSGALNFRQRLSKFGPTPVTPRASPAPVGTTGNVSRCCAAFATECGSSSGTILACTKGSSLSKIRSSYLVITAFVCPLLSLSLLSLSVLSACVLFRGDFFGLGERERAETN